MTFLIITNNNAIKNVMKNNIQTCALSLIKLIALLNDKVKADINTIYNTGLINIGSNNI